MTTAHGQSLMVPGQYLEPGEMLVSGNGIYKLFYTKDGLLELSAKTRESPETWTITWKYDVVPKENPGLCRIRQDGTFVVRSFNDKDGEPVPAGWFPESYQCQPGEKLVLRMQDDGNLVAYDDTETAYWSTNTWTARYAVLIGVNEYTNVSDKNLKAGCNDVLDMWKLCRRLGYRPEHIRVCTSPLLAREKIEAAELEAALARPENSGKSEEEVKPSVEKDLASAEPFWTDILGGATYEDITTAVGWLWLKLAEPFAKGKGYAVPGILYYSGHGTKVDGDLALCPADVHEDSDKNALPFEQITELFATEFKENNGHNPMEYLTVILDCCFAAAQEAESASKTQVVTTLKRPDTAKAAAEPSDIHPWLQRRVFCATRDNEPGYQALLGGRWHGAFTWALTRTLEQWTNQHSSAAFPYINISQAELLMRARMLLEALGFRQHPVLMDTFANTPMFWSGLARVETRAAGTAPKTSAEPDAERAGIQLQPDCKYTIDFGTDAKGNKFGGFVVYVLAANHQLTFNNAKANFPSEAPNQATEYWWDNINWNVLTPDNNPQSIQITSTALTFPAGINVIDVAENPGIPSFSCAADDGKAWLPSTDSPANPTNSTPSGAYYFVNTDVNQELEINTTDGKQTAGVVWKRWGSPGTAPTGTIQLSSGTWKKSVAQQTMKARNDWWIKASKPD